MNNISEIALLLTSNTKGRKTKNSRTAGDTQGRQKCCPFNEELFAFARIRRKVDKKKIFLFLPLLKKVHAFSSFAVMDNSMCHEVKETTKSNKKQWQGKYLAQFSALERMTKIIEAKVAFVTFLTYSTHFLRGVFLHTLRTTLC